jgi:two-component system LytT family response regulator
MTLRALIVDDERPARDELAFLLSAHADVTACEAASAGTALELIAAGRPDLVFQDIHMPGGDGFFVLEQAASLASPPLFVFVTAYDQHAIRAFEENAVDYLLKPVSPRRLAKCLDRVRARLAAGGREALRPPLEAFLAGLDRPRPLARLAVEQAGRIRLVPTREVVLIEAEDKRLAALTDHGRLTCHGLSSLAKAEERLAGLPFFRANRAVLVNLERIGELSPWFGGKYHLVMDDPGASEVTVSRNRARDFKDKLGL